MLHYETVSPVWGTAEPENGKTYPDFPVVGLRSCDRESILPLLTPGACSRTATVRSVLQCGCVRLQIPVAELAGETPEYVLVGSHYDSWDYGVTDNATGNALCWNWHGYCPRSSCGGVSKSRGGRPLQRTVCREHLVLR